MCLKYANGIMFDSYPGLPHTNFVLVKKGNQITDIWQFKYVATNQIDSMQTFIPLFPKSASNFANLKSHENKCQLGDFSKMKSELT